MEIGIRMNKGPNGEVQNHYSGKADCLRGSVNLNHRFSSQTQLLSPGIKALYHESQNHAKRIVKIEVGRTENEFAAVFYLTHYYYFIQLS